MEERGLRGFAGEERLDQFEVAHADRIQREASAALVKPNAVNMFQATLHGLLEVVHDSARGRGGGFVARRAHAIQRMHAEADVRSSGTA